MCLVLVKVFTKDRHYVCVTIYLETKWLLVRACEGFTFLLFMSPSLRLARHPSGLPFVLALRRAHGRFSHPVGAAPSAL